MSGHRRMQPIEGKAEEKLSYDHEKAISDWINEGGALGPRDYDEPIPRELA